jgi:sugar phosphate isomerase/epimerase
MRLGMVSYLVAAEMTLPEALETCVRYGFQGLELRTTHRHGVEPSLGPSERAEVRRRFQGSGVVLWGLGTTCEFHAQDPAEVRKNVQTAREFILLARDVGAVGVKVRPNGLQTASGVPAERTLEQIGRAYAEVGRIGQDHGVEVWMEVHGRDTQSPKAIRRILDVAAHPNCLVCWNSNPTDLDEHGGIDSSFALLAPWIRSCHINELANRSYPYRRLFQLLRSNGYGDRFTLAEISGTRDPERFLPYYRTLWEELSGEVPPERPVSTTG